MPEAFPEACRQSHARKVALKRGYAKSRAHIRDHGWANVDAKPEATTKALQASQQSGHATAYVDHLRVRANSADDSLDLENEGRPAEREIERLSSCDLILFEEADFIISTKSHLSPLRSRTALKATSRVDARDCGGAMTLEAKWLQQILSPQAAGEGGTDGAGAEAGDVVGGDSGGDTG